MVEVLAKEEEGELGMEEVVLATGHLQEYEGTALRKNKGKRSKSRKEQEAPSPHPRHPRHAGRVIPGGAARLPQLQPEAGARQQGPRDARPVRDLPRHRADQDQAELRQGGVREPPLPQEVSYRRVWGDAAGRWPLLKAGHITVAAAVLVHRVPSFGFLVTEPAAPGRLDTDRLLAR